MWRVGLGYRPELARGLASGELEVDCLELTAEHFFADGHDRIRALREKHVLLVHGIGLSLGTPGPLDRAYVERYAAVVRAADPLWISEHVAFTRAGGISLGHLNPVPRTASSLKTLVQHARELSDRCERRLVLENIATHIAPPGGVDEPDFLNALCEDAGCGLLLDVTNLVVNGKNHRFDPRDWLSRLEPRHVVEVHLVGYRRIADRYHDLHADNVQDEIVDLTRDLLRRTAPQAIVLERDDNFPTTAVLSREVERLKELRAVA